jgi:hypothetical protein
LTNDAGITGHSWAKINLKIPGCFTLFTKVNLKWIIDLNKTQNYKLLENNIREIYMTLLLQWLFRFNTKSMVCERSSWTLKSIKTKVFCFAETLSREEKDKTLGENMCEQYNR